MNTENNSTAESPKKRRFGCLHVLGFLFFAVIATAVVTFFAVRTYLAPADFRPVTLNSKEEQTLSEKLKRFGSFNVGQTRGSGDTQKETREKAPPLEPEPYSEEGASRNVAFTEKELNALLAKNTDLAKKLAIDLSDELVSAKLLMPMDEDFPILGGKTLKAKAGLEVAYETGKPIVILKGVTIMGVPIPNAWLGGIKNIDLVQEFGAQEGFWKAFSDGVENIRVEEGSLKIELKE